MQYSVLNDLAEAKRRRTEKKEPTSAVGNEGRHGQMCKRTGEGCSWAQWSQLRVPHESASKSMQPRWLVSGHRTYGHVDAAGMQEDECKNCV